MPGSPHGMHPDAKHAGRVPKRSHDQQYNPLPTDIVPKKPMPFPSHATRHVTPESVKINPYDIMTSKVWSASQHSRFIQALHKHGRQWKLISQELGTHTSSQVRSHAQKYFQKLQKLGMGHLIPPARQYKRKAPVSPTSNNSNRTQMDND